MSRCYVPRAATIGLLGLLIVLLPVLAGCSLQNRRTIRIFTSFPMQGVALGKSVVNAVQLAVEEKGGEVAGLSVELVVLDDGEAYRYRERFGSDPEAFSDYAYDATSAILAAIERSASPDRKAILNAMARLGDL